MSQLTCPHCGGTGLLLEARATGHEMRALRRSLKVSVARLAIALVWSRSYLHMLERGQRKWTPAMVASWGAAVELLAKQPPLKRARRAPRQTANAPALSGASAAPRDP